MANAVQNFQAFNGLGMDQAFASLDPTEESLADGIGGSYGVIKYKGKVWSLLLRNENHMFLRPDDGSPMNYIDVVILRQARVKAKSYYPGGFDENASAGKRPDCASIDGVTPDPDVPSKQSEQCALCKRNEWKTNAKTGKKERECQDYKRLSVLLLPSLTKPVLGEALVEPVFLRVPPASLNDLSLFGDMMQKQGFHFSSFVTRISFDVSVSHPKFIFKAQQRLGAKEAPIILSLREDVQAKRITGEDVMNLRLTAPVKPAQQIQTPTAATSIGLVPDEPKTVTATVTTLRTAQSVKPVQQVQQRVANHVPEDTGLGGLGDFGDTDPEDSYTPQPGASVGQTFEDTGEDGSIDDPDMDEKIKNLLG